MKIKKHSAQSAFFNLGASITLLVCGAAVCSMLGGALLAFFRTEAPSNTSHRTLTFEQRVAYQRAIEEVYWRHRIWPKERPDPKPRLDAVMSHAQLEKKVEDYLRKSQALEDYWQQPLGADQLQAEMDRMAQHTKQPEVLREVFQALDNDPFIIAECLARPILSERLKAAIVAWRKEPLGAQEARATNQMPVTMLTASTNYTLPVISDMSANSSSPTLGCFDDTWTLTRVTTACLITAPDARAQHTAVWTGSEMIIWGGFSSDIGYLNTGGKYNPTTDTWAATNTTNAPAGRSGHVAVWTGSEMIIWGGVGQGDYLNTGGRYNPSTDSWTVTNTSAAPSGRIFHTAVWTGSQMIVWGGNSNGGYLNTGGRYNPSTDSWTTTSAVGAPAGRYAHTVVWTGNQMIVWGGEDVNGYFNTGGRYNPTLDSWAATSVANAPDARGFHTAVWTGNQMILWSGYNGASYLNTGGRYDPGTDSWTTTSTTNAPAGRSEHTAVWTGSQMIVWGGRAGILTYFNSGGRYNPTTDSWAATSITGVPSARTYHTVVWTGSQMIVWGGYFFDGNDHYLNTGGRYCAQAGPPPTPTPTPTASATPTVVLYNQLNNPSTFGTSSQEFPDYPTLTDFAADDFVVPGGQTWHITEVDVRGGFFSGSGPVDNFNVFFYQNGGGLPGTQVYSAIGQCYVNIGGVFQVSLAVPAALTAGTYWVSVQAHMSGQRGQWGWTNRTVQSNSPAAWQNPGGGFGPPPSCPAPRCPMPCPNCTSWGISQCCTGIPAGQPDQLFRLIGTLEGLPTPTASPTPTPTPTPCIGRCSPTPRPFPTSAGRPSPPPHLSPPPTPTGSPRPTPAPRP